MSCKLKKKKAKFVEDIQNLYFSNPIFSQAVENMTASTIILLSRFHQWIVNLVFNRNEITHIVEKQLLMLGNKCVSLVLFQACLNRQHIHMVNNSNSMKERIVRSKLLLPVLGLPLERSLSFLFFMYPSNDSQHILKSTLNHFWYYCQLISYCNAITMSQRGPMNW